MVNKQATLIDYYIEYICGQSVKFMVGSLQTEKIYYIDRLCEIQGVTYVGDCPLIVSIQGEHQICNVGVAGLILGQFMTFDLNIKPHTNKKREKCNEESWTLFARKETVQNFYLVQYMVV